MAQSLLSRFNLELFPTKHTILRSQLFVNSPAHSFRRSGFSAQFLDAFPIAGLRLRRPSFEVSHSSDPVYPSLRCIVLLAQLCHRAFPMFHRSFFSTTSSTLVCRMAASPETLNLNLMSRCQGRCIQGQQTLVTLISLELLFYRSLYIKRHSSSLERAHGIALGFFVIAFVAESRPLTLSVPDIRHSTLASVTGHGI